MYLTKIEPDFTYPPARAEMHDIVKLRKRLMSFFPDDISANGQHRKEAGMLFRCEQNNDGPLILMQSKMKPSFGLAEIPVSYGKITILDITNHINDIKNGNQYHYRIVANTILKSRSGKITVIKDNTNNQLTDWWTQRCEYNGATPNHVNVHPLYPYRREEAFHTRTRFEGTLTVTNADTLQNAITNGIGQAKSYGLGLLSIKKVAT